MNHIDKKFKHKLEHYHVDVPEDVWDKIASRLPQPEKRYTPWWALFSIATVLLMSGVSTYFMSGLYANLENHLTSISFKDDKITPFEILPTTESSASTRFNPIQEVTGYTEKSRISKDVNFPFKHVNTLPQIQDLALLDKARVERPEISTREETTKIENRDFINISPIKNDIKKLSHLALYNLTPKGIFPKEKTVKACPFVIDVQDKSVDVYFSHDMVSKNLSGDPASEKYKNMRLSTETPIYSFSAGARFGYNLSYRWNIHTGFHYSQVNEKFAYIDPESSKTIITKTIDYIYDNGKIVDSIITEQTVVVPGTTSHTVYNKYRTFDIPVLGRYTLFASKQLSLSAVAGIYFNIASFQKGMILDPDNSKPTSLNSLMDEGNSMFKTQLGLTGYGSVSLAYHITDHVDFLLEPNIRIQTASMTTLHYPLDQRFNTYSVTTGLRYKF